MKKSRQVDVLRVPVEVWEMFSASDMKVLSVLRRSQRFETLGSTENQNAIPCNTFRSLKAIV